MFASLPLLLDGAMGTQLMRRGMPSGVCPEQWVLAHTEAAQEIQRSYVVAGSKVLYAPTFGANAAALGRYGLADKVREYNLALVKLSREIAGDALVAGDISATGWNLRPVGDKSFEELFAVYREQAAALEEAGVDLFVVETMVCLSDARAALLAIRSVSAKPVIVSFTSDEGGHTFMGTDLCAALLTLQGMGADAFGINCGDGPDKLLPTLQKLSELAEVPLLAKPNAGLPRTEDGKTVYDVSPENFVSYVPAFAELGVGLYGACCGSDATVISALHEALEGVSFRGPAPKDPSLLPCAWERGFCLLRADAELRTMLPCDNGLRTAVRRLPKGEPVVLELKSVEELPAFEAAQAFLKNPLCFSCEDASLLEQALRLYQGRALYRGGLSAEQLQPLTEKYGLICL